jgi:hypothetical protein
MEQDSHHESAPSLTGLLLPLLILAITIGTLAPFSPARDWGEAASSFTRGLKPSWHEVALFPLLERLATFLPLGLLIQWRLARWRVPYSLAYACLAVSLIVWILEFGQGFAPTRHPRLSDAVTGTAAGLLGAWLAGRLHPAHVRLREFYHRHWRITLGSLVLLGEAALIAAAVLAHRAVDFKGWDDTYPLLVANELTEDRPWRGGIRGLAIYPRELPAAEVAKLSQMPLDSASLATRADLGAIALYAFDNVGGGSIAQRIESEPPLDLVLPEPGPSTWMPDDRSIAITGPILIQSEGGAGTICRTIRAAGEFTVEVEVAISDTAQRGPARIVSISASPVQRNFTVGQHLGDIEFRVRTPRTGPNGTRVRCRTSGHPLTPGWHHIVASCGQGVLRIYVDGQEARAPLHLRWPAVMLFRTGVSAGGLLTATILFFPLGYLACPLFRAKRAGWAMLLALCTAGLLPLLVSWAVTASWDRDQDWRFLATAALACVAGAGMARWKRRAP